MKIELRPSLIFTVIGFLLCALFLVILVISITDWGDIPTAGILQILGLMFLLAAIILNIGESIVKTRQ